VGRDSGQQIKFLCLVGHNSGQQIKFPKHIQHWSKFSRLLFLSDVATIETKTALEMLQHNNIKEY
jgi:hypothetical protein